jgi:hypothetical protein
MGEKRGYFPATDHSVVRLLEGPIESLKSERIEGWAF